MLLAMIAVGAYEIAQNYVGPRRFVTVEFYEVTQTRTARDVTVTINRVTYQPGFDMRLGRTIRTKEPPLVIVDGIIENNGLELLIPFAAVDGGQTGAILSGQDRETSYSNVSILGKQRCQALEASVTMIPPGSSRRMSVRVPVGRGAEGAWIHGDLKKGRLAAISLGPFAYLDCAGDPSSADALATWRIDFAATDVEEADLRDYYPFGAPTTQNVGLQGRGYWTDWIPRID